jgi:D-alanyl-lipoteichoic acid acyltransferase DltB (MBOAT superfamily)
VGSAIFAIGLFKKVVLADTVALWADPVFDDAAAGGQPGLYAAWGGALAYTLQLYFDFSGYSDMAVGLARMFNIHLPINFFSPYKAKNISDFWRRWHITLSRFLRDYLYIPLGGNRSGRHRRYVNLMVTMLLGGLWHGAGWTFVVWGGLHGAYLGLALAWPSIRDGLKLPRLPARLASLVAWALTFLAVVVGWVFFRAESFDAAGRMLAGLAGLAGPALAPGAFGSAWGWFWILTLLAAAWLLPNTYELMVRYRPALITYPEHEAALRRALDRRHWRPRPTWAMGIATGFVAAFISLHREQVFLYFQF